MKPLPLVLAVMAFGFPVLAGDPANPILFVTQVPMPEEVNTRVITSSYMSCVSPFGNHLGATAYAGRGGSLWVRFPANVVPALNHQLVNLLAVADWGAIPGGKPAANTTAVRNPNVNWTADKAVFSMVIGVPSGPSDTTVFIWQLYEITLPTQSQLNANVKPVLTKVANQPAYNNVFPCYGLNGKFIFASDRPFNGQVHLTQREEYLGLPTLSGLWTLDPTDPASLNLLHHSPSGAFAPTVDSAGRVIFTNWDHLSRDIEAVTDERDSDPTYGEPAPTAFGGWHATGNGSGNFADETAGAAFTPGPVYGQAPHLDFFPEPRNSDKKTLKLEWNNTITGTTTNIFMPWMINVDGTGGEILNHVGRHEVAGAFTRNFTTDANIVDFNSATAPSATNGNYAIHNAFNNFMAPREDPLHPGTFYGADALDIGSHGAGRIVKLNNAGTSANGAPLNPDNITVTYLTTTAGVPSVKGGMNVPIANPQFIFPLSQPADIYRTPVPLSDGNLIASNVSVTQTDYNTGTVAAPQPVAGYAFRLKSLVLSGNTYVNELTLTTGLSINTTYWAGSTQVSYNGPAWELDPVEVVAPSHVPTAATSAVDPIEAGVFAANGVDVATFQKYLVAHNAALSVSRDVTKRDMHDRQQPFNLNVTWSNHQTIAPGTLNTAGSPGVPYNIAWLQILQGDLRRGYTLGGASPAPGRRVVATPLHDTMTENVATAGAPSGAVKLGDDGSFAAIVPANKALTWQLLDNDAAKTSQVKERFWVTFQKGEIRTCANCHGINTSDQTGTAANPVGRPTNSPQALAALLQYWKIGNPPGVLQTAAASGNALKNSGTITMVVNRVNGSIGPVSVTYATQGGTAVAGTDFTAASGTLTWADGDNASKTITISLLNDPVIAATKDFTVALSGSVNGSLGAQSSTLFSIKEPPYQAWLFQGLGSNANTPGIGGDKDDPDHDGLPNLVEYAVGGNPAVPDGALRQTPFRETLNAVPMFSFNFQRDLGKTDVTVKAQASSDLVSWQDVADSLVSTAGSIETRKASVPESSGLRFFHLLVTRP